MDESRIPDDRRPRDDPAGAAPETDPEVERFLGLIEHGRPEGAIDLALDRVHNGERVTHTVQQPLPPAQSLVGRRWHLGRYTVAQEHVASGVVEDVLGLLTTHTLRPHGQHAVARVGAEGEWHTAPARMAALCLRDAGWRVQFLGGSLPPEHLNRRPAPDGAPGCRHQLHPAVGVERRARVDRRLPPSPAVHDRRRPQLWPDDLRAQRLVSTATPLTS